MSAKKSDAPSTVFEAAKAIEEAIQGLEDADKRFALRIVCEYHGVHPPAPKSDTPDVKDDEDGGSGGADEEATPEHPSLKSYMTGVAKVSAMGFAAHLAFFWKFKSAEKRDQISTKDYAAACRAAGRNVPDNLSKPLSNAKTNGYLEDAGHGKYRLSNKGENFARGTLRKSETKASRRRAKRTSKKTPKRAPKKPRKKAPKKTPKKTPKKAPKGVAQAAPKKVAAATR